MTLSLGIPGLHRDPSSAPSTEGRPDASGLVDRSGRVARDLRTADGIPRLVGIAVRDLGMRDIRFTGGEPLMRADLEEIGLDKCIALLSVRLTLTCPTVWLPSLV